MKRIYLMLVLGMLWVIQLSAFEGEVAWEPGFGSMWHSYTLCVADVNGDLQNELIFPNSDGYVYVTSFSNGDLSTHWRSPSLKYRPMRLQCYDLDNDGIPEIVGGGGIEEMGGYFVIDHLAGDDYEMILQNEDHPDFAFHVRIADLDADGSGELITREEDLCTINEYLDGEFMASATEDSIFPQLVGQFDLNSLPWVLCQGYAYSDNNGLGFWQYDGQDFSEIWAGWMGSPTIGSAQRYGVGDLDGDGDDEIVVLNGTGEDMDTIQGLYVWDYDPDAHDFILMWSTWTDVYQDNALVDIGDTDGDGLAEIVVWVRSINNDSKEYIYIFKYQAGNFELIHESAQMPVEVIRGDALVVGDADNDGYDEIIVGDQASLLIYGFNESSSDYEFEYFNETFARFAYGHGIDDFNRDGMNEIGLLEIWEQYVSFWSFQEDDYVSSWQSNYILDVHDTGGSNHIINVLFDSESEPKTLVSTGQFLAIGTFDDTTFVTEWFDPEYDGLGACFYDVGQMDDDPDEEIVASNWWYEDLYSMDYNRETDDYTITLIDDGVEFSQSVHPALLDLDGDGLDEIVMAAHNNTLRVFKKQGDDYLLWFVHPLIYGNIWTAIDKADLDQDGDEELIYGGVYDNSYYGRLQALDFDPDQIRLVTFHDFGDPPFFITGCKVGELGPAHRKVLVVTVAQYPYLVVESYVQVYDLTTFELLWQSDNLGIKAGYLNSISIGDSDNDGENELLVSTDFYLHLFEFTDPVGIEEPISAEVIRLSQSWPNPIIAGQPTSINFDLPAPASVSVSIYNAAGQRVKQLATGNREPGTHQITWDGQNETGQPVGSGVYFYRLQAVSAGQEQVIQTRKMVVIR